jgi:hypothetical protein
VTRIDFGTGERESDSDVELGLLEADNPTSPHWMRVNHRGDGDRTSQQHMRHQLGGRW